MLDLKFIRQYPQLIRDAAKHKNHEIQLDEFLRLDKTKRELQTRLESDRQQKNQLSQQINQFQKAEKPFHSLRAEIQQLNHKINEIDQTILQLNRSIYAIQVRFPNLPHPSVPIGASAKDNIILRTWDEPGSVDFPLQPHWEIGEKLGILDFEGGSKVAGSFFVNFKGWGARLSRALINFMLDLHIREHGYLEVSPPFLARREALFYTGQLPLLESEMYRLEQDDLFLIPTSEVPLTGLHQNDVFAAAELPVKYTAYSPCFRREAGTHGRENRGLIRMHQFDKVELVQLVTPENSYQVLETLLGQAEKVLQLLELPYRVVELCTGELSFAAAKCYDLEVWAPAQRKYLEVSSCSNFEAFQARRANIRFRPGKGKKLQYVHTLNASGVALPRTIVAILENYQTDEGTVIVPKVLRKYMETAVIKAP